jgi:hypothetical protein
MSWFSTDQKLAQSIAFPPWWPYLPYTIPIHQNLSNRKFASGVWGLYREDPFDIGISIGFYRNVLYLWHQNQDIWKFSPIDPTTRAVLALACCEIHRQRLILTRKTDGFDIQHVFAQCYWKTSPLWLRLICKVLLKPWNGFWVNARKPLRGHQTTVPPQHSVHKLKPRVFHLRQSQ